MNDMPSGFVYTDDLASQARSVESWIKRESRRNRHAAWMWRIYGGAMTLIVVMLAGALNYAIPLRQVMPVFFYQRADGTVEFALSTDSMPADVADANIQTFLWQYVAHRESYSWAEADMNHHMVSAMSSVPVRQAYEAWSNGMNPQSYLAVYGTHGVVRVRLREITAFTRASASVPGKMTLHYERGVEVDGQLEGPPHLWSVTLQYVQNYSSGFNVRDLAEFNPSRIVVTAYGSPLPLSAKVQP